MKTNSGTATNEKLLAFDHATEPTTPSPTVQPLSQRSPTRPTRPSEKAISRPSEKNRNSSASRMVPASASLTPRASPRPPRRDPRAGPRAARSWRPSVASIATAISASPVGISSMAGQSAKSITTDTR